MRKFFRTELGAVIPVDIVETLMGHEGYLTEVYRRYSFEDLGKFYQQGEHALIIFGSGEDVNKLREEIEDHVRYTEDNFRVTCSYCRKPMYFSERKSYWPKTKKNT